MDSPALRAQPLKSSPARGRSWIPSTSCALAGDALDECRRRTGQERHHRRGRATDPLYKARRMLHTGSCLLTLRQQHQILDLFASDCHVALEVTWSVYQNITRRLPRARHEGGQGPDASRHQHTDLHARTEEPDRTHDAGQDTQTPSRGHPGLLRPPPHQQWPHRSRQRPRTPTRIRTRTSDTSPTTSPEHSSKQEDSDPNYTPNYEEPTNSQQRAHRPTPYDTAEESVLEMR